MWTPKAKPPVEQQILNAPSATDPLVQKDIDDRKEIMRRLDSLQESVNSLTNDVRGALQLPEAGDDVQDEGDERLAQSFGPDERDLLLLYSVIKRLRPKGLGFSEADWDIIAKENLAKAGRTKMNMRFIRAELKCKALRQSLHTVQESTSEKQQAEAAGKGDHSSNETDLSEGSKGSADNATDEATILASTGEDDEPAASSSSSSSKKVVARKKPTNRRKAGGGRNGKEEDVKSEELKGKGNEQDIGTQSRGHKNPESATHPTGQPWDITIQNRSLRARDKKTIGTGGSDKLNDGLTDKRRRK